MVSLSYKSNMIDIDMDYLYDPSLLKDLDWNSVHFNICDATADKWLQIRPLHLTDYDKGYLDILKELTNVGQVTKQQFEQQFLRMRKTAHYYVTVIEDERVNKIIAAATLVIEYKMIHNCGIRGRLEDVVVNQTYRGKQLGKLIVLTVTLLAKKLGSYKMTLDCKDNLIRFYESLGYKMEIGNANSMTWRFDDGS